MILEKCFRNASTKTNKYKPWNRYYLVISIAMGISYEVITDSDECGRILQENFLNKFRKGYITIEGVTMPLRYAEMAEEILNWEVYDSDLWISSFPKTGTTWTQEMTWMIGNNVDIEGGKENLGVRFPFLE